MTVAIVGAGLSGLALAHGLVARGQRVRLFERSDRAGGQIRSHAEAGFLTEDGPNALLDRDPAVRTLVRALGLADVVVRPGPAARRRYVWSRGRLWPLTPPALLVSGPLSWKGKLRLLAEPFTPRPAASSRSTDESLGAFARRHVGDEATEVLVDAAQTGVFAGDLEKLSVAAAFPAIAAMAEAHRSLAVGLLSGRGPGGGSEGGPLSFAGGLEALPRALAESLGGTLQTGAPVHALRRSGTEWQLEVNGAAGATQVAARRVVLATPPDAAAALVRPFAPELAALLEEIPFVPMAMVHLGFAPGALTAPDGFGFLVPSREGRQLLGAIHASTVFPARAPEGGVLVTCLFGGARHPEVVMQDDAALASLAREELRALAGLSAAPVQTRVVRWSRGIPQYEVGHLARLARIDAACAQWPGLVLSGNAYRGPGLADCIRNAAALTEALVQAG